MITVIAAIIIQNGKLLIAQRAAGDKLEYKWEFPGGKIEEHETPEECLKRELYEEFHVESEIGDFLGSIIFDYEHFSIELMAYKTHFLSEALVLNSHEKIKWVTFSELINEDLAQADIALLEELRGVIE